MAIIVPRRDYLLLGLFALNLGTIAVGGYFVYEVAQKFRAMELYHRNSRVWEAIRILQQKVDYLE